MADNIAVRIALEGAADVQTKLKQLGLEGDAALKRLQQAASGLTPAFNDAGQGADTFRGKMSLGTQIMEGFKNTLATARPALQQYGSNLGGVGAIAASTRAGIVGLAAAIAGALVVALAKAAEEATRTRQRLGEILQNRQLGTNAFKGLEDDAKRSGVAVGDLTKSFENLTRAQQKFGQDTNIIRPPNLAGVVDDASLKRVQQAREALSALMNLLRASGLDTQKAKEAADEFTASLASQGKVTKEALEALQKAAPGAADKLAQSMQRMGAPFKNADDLIKALGQNSTLSANEAIKALQKIGPDSAKSLDAAKQEFRTFSDAVDDLQKKISTFGGLGEGGGPGLQDRIGSKVVEGIDAITKAVGLASDGWKKFLADISPTANQVGESLKGAFNTLAPAVTQTLSQVGQALSSAWEAATSGATEFVDNVKQVFQSLVADLSSIGSSISEAFTTAFDSVRQGFESFGSAVETLKSALSGMWTGAQEAGSAFIEHIKTVFQSLVSDISSIGGSIRDALVNAFEAAKNAILEVINTIKVAWASISGGSGLDGSEPSLSDGGGFARGGLLRGQGTGTSDSILGRVGRQIIRLSNGEFVIRDAARRYYGVEVMHAINSMKLPRNLFKGFALGGLVGADRRRSSAPSIIRLPRDTIRGFSMGGLISGMASALSALPGFADGGELAGMAGGGAQLAPVTINLGGGRSIRGLSAPADVIRQLQREALIDQIVSSPAPSRGSARG